MVFLKEVKKEGRVGWGRSKGYTINNGIYRWARTCCWLASGPILIHIEGHIDNIHQDHACPVGTAKRTPSTIFSSNCLALKDLTVVSNVFIFTLPHYP
jgi:hypothetical protein